MRLIIQSQRHSSIGSRLRIYVSLISGNAPFYPDTVKYGLIFLLLGSLIPFVPIFEESCPPWCYAWVGICFLYIGIAYTINWPGLFGKKQVGRIPVWFHILFLPYFILLYVSNLISLWLTRKHRVWNQLTDHVYIGRRFFSFQLKHLKYHEIDSILDLTAEFSEPKFAVGRFNYRSIPILDNHVTDLDKLEKAAGWIETEVAANRKVFIHCAMGHGRTGLVTGAWLISSNQAASAEEALMMMQTVRPALRLKTHQFRLLEAFAGR